MVECPRCGRSVELHHTVCGHCAAPLTDPLVPEASPAEHAGPHTAVARFLNAAEAGYFAHELQHEAGIPASVHLDESFDAISGYWSTRFVLSVPDALAEEARQRLQHLVAESDADDDVPWQDPQQELPGEDRERHVSTAEIAEETESGSGVNWVPIMLTLAAGSVVFWGVRKVQAPPRAQAAAPGGHEQVDLWEHLGTSDRPWVQQTENGIGRRELRFDQRRRKALLYEDLDGDGRFETQTPLRITIPAP